VPPEYSIHYELLFGALQKIDVQALVDNANDPWYNQTLVQVGEILVRLGVMKGEFHWHKHDEQDEFFFVLDGQFSIELEGPRPSSLARCRHSASRLACCTAPSCRFAAQYS
jgi:oxalate decarboxylase/phosphoglucose isomerase-like protein (cupin superfamily)